MLADPGVGASTAALVGVRFASASAVEASTSAASTAPPGPDPAIVAIFTPRSVAIRRALGEAARRSFLASALDGAVPKAGAACTAVCLDSAGKFTGAGTALKSGGGGVDLELMASSGEMITAITFATGTSSP